MDEEDFPRRSRSKSAASTSEKKEGKTGRKKKEGKDDSNKLLFQVSIFGKNKKVDLTDPIQK